MTQIATPSISDTEKIGKNIMEKSQTLQVLIALIVVSLLPFGKLLKKWWVKKSSPLSLDQPTSVSTADKPTTYLSHRKRGIEEIGESNSKHNKRETQNPIPENTSSVPSSARGVYEVFLSFSGKDTRKGFTDYLYNDLIYSGIRTFRDDNELRVGEEIGPELLKAIEDSKISIPIFSKTYAYSKWCLKELTHMVHCYNTNGLTIFPIFYDVDPSDVRHQTGGYEEAFHEHAANFDNMTIQGWKKALTQVGNLKGLELKKETGGREGELVKKVVKKILSDLKKNFMELPDKLVGMDHHIEKMNELLDLNSNGIRIVGIHGMGGIGKTTISKVIYNYLCECFECCCFLEDVRENSKQHSDLVNLKNELLSKIRKGKDFLIVLDDVNETSQFDELVGKGDEFGSRGRIIITTRNKEVLDILGKKHSSDVYRSYEPQYMNYGDSLQLFSKHAFLKNSPPTDYYKLAENIINTAGGLPLVLVTIGSLLFVREDKAYWEETLKKLKKIPHKDVFESLRISYDSLDNVQQEIFLDIACLRRNIKEFRYMWEDLDFFPTTGIEILIQRSLIKVGDDGEIWMHDHIRDLGRKIAEHNRLSLSGDACDVLESCTGAEKIVALHIRNPDDEWTKNWDPNPIPPEDVVGEHLMKLRNLRYLEVKNVNFVGDSKHLTHLNLRWLDCVGYRINLDLPNFQLKNLVVLQLSDYNISNDWEGWSQIKMATKLKVLHLSYIHCLKRLDCSAFATLESLKLYSCTSLRILDGLEELKSLTYLNTFCCGSLERLSDLSNLEKLKELDISWCGKLSEIRGMSGLKSLERLDVSWCGSIEKLPDLSKLKMLKELNTLCCRKLHEVEGLTVLESLEHLDLSSTSVQGILDLSNLKKLKKLRAFRLELTEIQGTKELKWLQVLDIGFCSLIEKLPDLSNFEDLEKIEASNCEKLIEIEGLEKMKSLVSLDISGCRSIKELPDLSNLKNLKKLLASNCYELTEIRGLEELNSLEELAIDGCKSIEKLCDLSNLEVLKELDVSGCEKLTEIMGLELKSLKELSIKGCNSIERLPDLSNLEVLKKLDVSGCKKLTEIMGLEVLKSLKKLSIEGCNSIERLPDLSNLEVLEKLDVSGREKLTEIMGLEVLKSLKELSIKRCNSIERLPDLSNLEFFKKLDVSGCEKLTEIMGLEVLKSLQVLSIKGCNSIERLPDLTKLTNLWMFNGIWDIELWSIHESNSDLQYGHAAAPSDRETNQKVDERSGRYI